MKNFLLCLCFLVISLAASGQKSISLNRSCKRGQYYLPVKISGTNMHFASGSNTVSFFYSGTTTAFVVMPNAMAINNNSLAGIVYVSSFAPLGYYDCSIKNSTDGTVTSYSAFQVLAADTGKYILPVTPDSAMAGESLRVLITGYNTHFSQGSPTNLLTFTDSNNPTPAPITVSSVKVLSNTSLRANIAVSATAPAIAYGVHVENSNDGVIPSSFAPYPVPFYVGPSGPKLRAIAAESANQGQTLNVNITGARTNFTQATPTVAFFSSSSPTIKVNYISVKNDSTLSANISIPSNAYSGYHTVGVVTNERPLYLPESFEVIPVSGRYVSMSPAAGATGQSLPVSITGIGTSFTKGSSSVQFYRQGSPTSAISLSNITIGSNTLMGGIVSVGNNAATGTYTFKVTTVNDGVATSTNSFLVYQAAGASITAVTPDNGTKGTTLDVYITGTGTHFHQGSGTSYIQFMKQGSPTTEVMSLGSSAVNNTGLGATLAIASNARTGPYDVMVYNTTDGSMTLTNAFTVTENTGPALVSVTPPKGHLRETLNVTITGTRTQFSQASQTIVFFRQSTPSIEIQVNNITVNNDSNLTANISITNDAERGWYSVGVIQGSGTGALVLNDAFEVDWALGLNNPERMEVLEVYPNPAHDQLTVKSRSGNIEQAELSDITGRIIFTCIPPTPGSEWSVSLAPYMLPPQCYFIKITTREGTHYRKLIVK